MRWSLGRREWPLQTLPGHVLEVIWVYAHSTLTPCMSRCWHSGRVDPCSQNRTLRHDWACCTNLQKLLKSRNPNPKCPFQLLEVSMTVVYFHEKKAIFQHKFSSKSVHTFPTVFWEHATLWESFRNGSFGNTRPAAFIAVERLRTVLIVAFGKERHKTATTFCIK